MVCRRVFIILKKSHYTCNKYVFVYVLIFRIRLVCLSVVVVVVVVGLVKLLFLLFVVYLFFFFLLFLNLCFGDISWCTFSFV